MNLRRSIASLAIAAGLLVGFAGVADAQTAPSPAPSTTDHHFTCDNAHDLIARLHARIDAVKDRIARAEARVDRLRQEGKNERADALAKRIETAKDRIGEIEARLATLEARVDKRCSPDPTTDSGSSTDANSV